MNKRQGITTTELVCASLIIGVVATMLVPAMKLVSRQNESSLEHLEAGAVLSNILDGVTASPFSEVTADSLGQTELPEWANQRLVNAELEMGVEPRDGGKQVTAELSWQVSHSNTREKARLQTWIFPGGSP